MCGRHERYNISKRFSDRLQTRFCFAMSITETKRYIVVSTGIAVVMELGCKLKICITTEKKANLGMRATFLCQITTSHKYIRQINKIHMTKFVSQLSIQEGHPQRTRKQWIFGKNFGNSSSGDMILGQPSSLKQRHQTYPKRWTSIS